MPKMRTRRVSCGMRSHVVIPWAVVGPCEVEKPMRNVADLESRSPFANSDVGPSRQLRDFNPFVASPRGSACPVRKGDQMTASNIESQMRP